MDAWNRPTGLITVFSETKAVPVIGNPLVVATLKYLWRWKEGQFDDNKAKKYIQEVSTKAA